MIPHCGVCATWQRLSRTLSTLGSCEVEAARQTKGPFRCSVALMPYHQWCKEWKERDGVQEAGKC